MSFEENLKKANEALEKLNESELSLDDSVKIYKMGLLSIQKAREDLEKAKLEVEKIDE
ncbi:MAG: exodeoxyribonuclease VII small subunit [Campylobacter sp.]|nr:exodeoxyribonuclease VII small subunit [Campylobacter sp.]